MAKQCTSCRQLLADEAARCSHCGVRQQLAPTSNPPRQSDADADAEIDLGSPVRVGIGPAGPPSGASFISWNTLIRARKQSLHQGTAGPRSVFVTASTAKTAPRTVSSGAPDHSLTQAAAASGRLRAGLAGFILGGVASAGIWLAGLEPPESWRQPVLRWLRDGAETVPPAAPSSPGDRP